MAKMIRVTAKREGFRRAGIAHPATPTTYPADRFSDKERSALEAEPMLVVEEVEAAEAETDEKKAAGTKAGAKASSPAGK